MDWGAIAQIVGGIFAALITGLVTYAVARNKSRADIVVAREAAEAATTEKAQESINQGFQLLIGAMQTRLQAQEDDFKRERELWRDQMRQEREDFERERRELTEQIGSLKSEVSRLSSTVVRLEKELRKNGIEVPVETASAARAKASPKPESRRGST